MKYFTIPSGFPYLLRQVGHHYLLRIGGESYKLIGRLVTLTGNQELRIIMINNTCPYSLCSTDHTTQLDKTRKVAELDRAELDALAASVKNTLKQDKIRPALDITINEVPLNARILGILMPPTV